MSTIKSSAENLTLNADGANNDIKFQSNGSEVASIDQAGLLTATSFAGSGANLTNIPATDISGKLNLSGGTMSGNLVVSGDIDMTGVLNGTAGSMDIKNEANGENIFIKTTSGGSEVTALKIHSGGTIELGTGQGLRVGGTAAANTLDNYEEGTWTPVFTFGGGSTGLTYYNQTGTYTRIGDVVFFWCSIHKSGNGSSTGNAALGGFPIAARTVSYMQFLPVGPRGPMSVSGDHITIHLAGGATSFVIHAANNNGSNHYALTQANFPDNSEFNVSGHYYV